MTKKKPVDPAVENPAGEDDSTPITDRVLKTPPPTLLPEKHIKVDLHANGGYQVMDAPRGWYFDRRISLIQKGVRGSAESGFTPYEVVVNLEHVADDENGIWCYRVM